MIFMIPMSGSVGSVVDAFIDGEKLRLAPILDSAALAVFEKTLRREFADIDFSLSDNFLANNICVCGRSGAGKSTFVENFRTSPLFGGLYEVDFDRFAAPEPTKVAETLNYALSQAVSRFLERTGLPFLLTDILPEHNLMLRESVKPVRPMITHVFYCATAEVKKRLEARDRQHTHPVTSGPAALYTQAPYIMSVGTLLQRSHRAILWDVSVHGRAMPMATAERQASGACDIVVHDADGLAAYGHDQFSLGLSCRLALAHPRALKPLWGALIDEMEGMAGGGGDEPPRLAPLFNDRFDVARFMDWFKYTAKMYRDQVADFAAAFSDCDRILSGRAVDGLGLRQASAGEKLPVLVTTRPWREQQGALAAFADFNAVPVPPVPAVFPRPRAAVARAAL